MKRVEVTVRQVIKEYSICKARLSIDNLGHESQKMDHILEQIDQEKRKLEAEMERELTMICQTP